MHYDLRMSYFSQVQQWSSKFLFKGKRIAFRAERKDDLKSIWKMYSTLGKQSIENLPPISKNLVERWVKNQDFDKTLVIVALHEDMVVGRAVLHFGEHDSINHKGEFGVVVHDDFQGLGIGSKLTEIMIGFAQSKGLRKVFLEVFSGNDVAIHVYEKFGFVSEGLFRDHYFFRNQFYDVIVMGKMLETEQ